MKRLLSCFICITALMLFTAIPTVADDSFDESTQPILNVRVPSTVDFVIDPFELMGRGQIYSEMFPIINYGETDVLLTFTDLEVIFANDTDFELLSEPFSETGFYDSKSVYLVLDFGRNDIPPVVITDAETTALTSILLPAGQGDIGCILSINGSVNPYPTIDWENGDIRLRLVYQMDALPNNEPEDVLIESDDISDDEAVLDVNDEEATLPEADKENEITVGDDENITEQIPSVIEMETEYEEESTLPEVDKENETIVDDVGQITQEAPPVIEIEKKEEQENTTDDETELDKEETLLTDSIDEENEETE